MLGKLIKYDIRSTWRDFAAVYLSILLGVIVLPLIFRNVENPLIDAIAGFVAAAIVIMIAMFFKIFNTSVFSKSGYLTMTLPAASSQIVTSKLLVSAMWIVLTGIVSFIGVCLFVWNSAPLTDTDITSLKKVLSLIGTREILLITLTAAVIVVSTVKEIAKLFLACSVAHLRQLGRFRIPIGILSYFVFSWLEVIVLRIAGFVIALFPNTDEFIRQIDFISDTGNIYMYFDIFTGVMVSAIFYALILITVYGVSIVWILNHKLDLD